MRVPLAIRYALIFLLNFSVITLSGNNAATSNPNQSPAFAADASADPTTAILELHSLLTLLHLNTCNTFIDHRTQISNVQNIVNAIPPPPPAPALAPCSIKGAKLDQFLGKVQDVECFLQDLCDNNELQGPVFVSDQQKVLYMASFLCKTQTAHNWVAGTRVSHPDWFNNFEAFTQGFKAHFGSPNKINEALHKLQNLKQAGSAALYAAQFREISAALPQEEFFLSNMFFNGLKQEVQRWILQLPNSKTGSLDNLVTCAINFSKNILML